MTTELTLADIQRTMDLALRRTEGISAEASLAATTEAMVRVGLRLSPVDQLEIYREQFWLRHIGAMKEDFVTVDHLLGEDGFRAACEAYIAAHPPSSFTLRDLGDGFPSFLHDHEPWSNDALLHDCAVLEWAFVEAFDAPDAPPLDPSGLEGASEEAWASAKVVFHPSVQAVRLSHPAHVLRAAVRDRAEGEGPPPGRPERAETCVVVYRGPEKLMYIAIEPLAFELLGLLSQGTPLAEACETLAKRAGIADTSELEPKVSAWFQAWAAYGWVCRVDFG